MDIFWAKSWKIGQNQFFGWVFFCKKKWGTNKIEYVCICHGHSWVSVQNSIPTLTNYHTPLLKRCFFLFNGSEFNQKLISNVFRIFKILKLLESFSKKYKKGREMCKIASPPYARLAAMTLMRTNTYETILKHYWNTFETLVRFWVVLIE